MSQSKVTSAAFHASVTSSGGKEEARGAQFPGTSLHRPGNWGFKLSTRDHRVLELLKNWGRACVCVCVCARARMYTHVPLTMWTE